jgi:hypothetical protein
MQQNNLAPHKWHHRTIYDVQQNFSRCIEKKIYKRGLDWIGLGKVFSRWRREESMHGRIIRVCVRFATGSKPTSSQVATQNDNLENGELWYKELPLLTIQVQRLTGSARMDGVNGVT